MPWLLIVVVELCGERGYDLLAQLGWRHERKYTFDTTTTNDS
jgi:hypothetical protein